MCFICDVFVLLCTLRLYLEFMYLGGEVYEATLRVRQRERA